MPRLTLLLKSLGCAVAGIVLVLAALGLAHATPPADAPPTLPAPTLAAAGGDVPQRGGILVISTDMGTPKHFNPALISGSTTAISGTQIFASPLRYDEKWNPQSYLARSWEIAPDCPAVIRPSRPRPASLLVTLADACQGDLP